MIIMSWKNDKYRHSLAKRKIITANGKFLSENHPKRQTEEYPEYIINENSIQYIPEEDLEKIYEKSRNQLVIIHYPNISAKMTITSKRIIYEEIIHKLSKFSNIEERNEILLKIHMYGELQKMKGYKDNIYRTYSFNYNEKTKQYEVKIEMLGDTIKGTTKNDFVKTMKVLENQAIKESIDAKRYINQITMEEWL